ncbi:MAG: exo-alpha-sialidase [Sedimentisphaerales bacterium]|nr:exo-alpha-sialidase [Sedimentisphaerales bacterium]
MKSFIRIILVLLLTASISWGAPPYPTDSPDASLNPPKVNFSPEPAYAADTRLWQGIPAIEVAPNGRLWAAWYSGGPSKPGQHIEGPDNYVLLVTSSDQGHSWSEPILVIDPPGPTRAFDPALWMDPTGCLWLTWAQSFNHFDGRAGVWSLRTHNPTDPAPTWTSPKRIANGIMMNKPTVTDTGQWLFPIAVWNHQPWEAMIKQGKVLPQEVRSNLWSTSDQGKTFTLMVGPEVPLGPDDTHRAADEHMVVQRRDHSLWLLIRTLDGISQSTSTDLGRTWSAPRPAEIAHPSARFFIRRLSSGRLLLIKHGPLRQKTTRTDLTAYLSDDDGQTWPHSLLLDGRDLVSYPDAAQHSDKTIYIIYDRSRKDEKEILLARITEQDILAGELVNPHSKLKMLVNKAQHKADKRTK